MFINLHHLDRLTDHQKLNVIYKNEYFLFLLLMGPLGTLQLTFIAQIARSITTS